MGIFEAILLGLVEGITEFLPISSTGHLTILEKLLGYKIDDPGITAFTAIIQIGAVAATLVYLRNDIVKLLTAWTKGLVQSNARTHDYRFAWAVIIGAIPICIIGFLFKDQIETTLRSLWFVAIAMITWSGAMWVADHVGKQNRDYARVTWKDTLIIGITQCLSLIPGVSRSGATMTAGLLRGLDRVSVTKLSFLLSIPALVAATLLEVASKYHDISNGVGWVSTITATIVSFFVAYMAIAWLLKFIAHHSYNVFIGYRLVLGAILIVLLVTNTITAT